MTTSDTTAANALAFINAALGSGRTVYVSTMTKVTAVSPKTAASWARAGRTLFKVGPSGNLLMASGKTFVRLSSGDMMLVGLSAG